MRLKVQADYAPEAVALRIIREVNGELREEELKMMPGEKKDRVVFYEEGLFASSSPGLLWYHFAVEHKGKTYFYGNNTDNLGGSGRIYESDPFSYQVTVYKPDSTTPDWLKNAVIYQIFPDRFFNDSEDGKILNPKKNSLLHSHWDNSPVYIRDLETGRVVRWDFFGGNLAGVRKKLPYLKKLGINVIYFNPIFESPSNHRYDTADYHNIDPMLGDNQLFTELCAEAAEMGISIVLDGVFSHTGSDSIYFNKEGNYDSLGAYQSIYSPYFPWYIFIEFPHLYESWWGIETMPNANELEPSYQDFIIFGENSVLKHWHKMGIKGWRLDVVDELPGQFIKNLRGVMKELDPQSVLIGEVWEDASNKVSYDVRREYLLGEELDSPTNYPLRQAVMDFLTGRKEAAMTHLSIMSFYENYPRQHFYSTVNMTGSHDVPRILTVLSEEIPDHLPAEEKVRVKMERLKLFSLLLFTMPGVPCIYYGDEADLEGGEDPLNRCTYPWGRENEALLHWFRLLSALRNHYDILRTGSWTLLHAREDLYCYIRNIADGQDVFGHKKKDNTAVVLLNRNLEKETTLVLDLKQWCDDKLVDPLDDYREVPLKKGKLHISLGPLEGKLLLQDRWGDNAEVSRESGILLHPTSLPSRHGIGDMGKEAYDFVDFLARSGQKLWQILPLNPPGYGESPYQCFSAFAGNALLISPEAFLEEGLITKEDLKKTPSFSQERVNFDEVKEYKEALFRKAYHRFSEQGHNGEYKEFCSGNQNWLEDYVLFMALKKYFHGRPWNRWEKEIAFREKEALHQFRDELSLEIDYHRFLQFIFFKQWQELKDYANSRGIRIIGDLPIFVSHDSSDVWSNPALFELDEEGNPLKVAGVPPDYFSETGQLWGNPHYRWHLMEEDGYRWWKERFSTLAELVDIIRIDHFRGFETYWEVPGTETTAVNGRWVKGPGEKFFKSIRDSLGDTAVIAENLGFITPPVEDLRIRFGFPGMVIMQFTMEGRPGEQFALPLYERETAVYTGTHDNDTILGWHRKKHRVGYSGEKNENERENDAEICWHYIEMALRSDAAMVIIPLQDILCLGSEARMNTPGTVGENWSWRFPPHSLKDETASRLKRLTRHYNRSSSS